MKYYEKWLTNLEYEIFSIPKPDLIILLVVPPEIGQKLGGRDHSTVIHACEKIRTESNIDEPLKQELVLIKERVYNSFDK